MSFISGVLFGVAAGAFVSARVGLFGTDKITVYADGEYESISNCILFHQAHWIPADTRAMVYSTSLRPIEFVQSEERLCKY